MPTREIASGGVTLWAEDLGPATAPPLLLLMGANASAMGWPPPFLERLVAGGFRVLRYDHRDTGRSTRRDFASHPFSVEDLARDAVRVLDGFGVESAHVFGFSLGCTLGQVLALDHRERLRTLAVAAGAALDVDFVGNLGRALRGEPSPDGLPTPDPAVLQVLGKRALPIADLEAELDRRVDEWRALSGPGVPFDPAEFRAWEKLAIDHAETLAQPFAHALATPVPLSRGAELSGVTTPTLVIQAPADPLNPPPHGRHLAGLIPGAAYAEVPGMGHALPSAVQAPLARLLLDHALRPGRG
jgi:10-carbomethoxy-13-deoxycarminomycin esterase/esterase